jgi:hypothetical protein
MPDPRGFITFKSRDRVAVIITASGRKPPKDDAEAAALFRGMSAYTGRFTVAGNRVITEMDAAWRPVWEDSQQPRFYELDGNRLTLKIEVQDHPSHPSRQLQGIVVWTRPVTQTGTAWRRHRRRSHHYSVTSGMIGMDGTQEAAP